MYIANEYLNFVKTIKFILTFLKYGLSKANNILPSKI